MRKRRLSFYLQLFGYPWTKGWGTSLRDRYASTDIGPGFGKQADTESTFSEKSAKLARRWEEIRSGLNYAGLADSIRLEVISNGPEPHILKAFTVCPLLCYLLFLFVPGIKLL